MNIRYRVELSETERDELTALLKCQSALKSFHVTASKIFHFSCGPGGFLSLFETE